MMLRLGELVIGQKHPDILAAIEAQPCAPGDRWTRERTMSGFDEGQVTAEVARRWDFPEELTQALQWCARPLHGPVFSKLGGIVHLAALLADTPNVTPETLDALPVALTLALHLDMPCLRSSLPDAELLSDTSTLQA